MKDVIKKETQFNHPIESVWNAITKAEEISTWFIQADFKAEKGYQYTFTASEDKGCLTITGEVKNSTPYELVYTWIVKNTDVETIVTWKLEPTKEGTKLYLEHSGISNYVGDTAIAMFESFNAGWDGCRWALSRDLRQSAYDFAAVFEVRVPSGRVGAQRGVVCCHSCRCTADRPASIADSR